MSVPQYMEGALRILDPVYTEEGIPVEHVMDYINYLVKVCLFALPSHGVKYWPLQPGKLPWQSLSTNTSCSLPSLCPNMPKWVIFDILAKPLGSLLLGHSFVSGLEHYLKSKKLKAASCLNADILYPSSHFMAWGAPKYRIFTQRYPCCAVKFLTYCLTLAPTILPVVTVTRTLPFPCHTS